MDPAVVAVHQMAPPPNSNFTISSSYTEEQPQVTQQPIVNGNHESDHTPLPQANAQIDFDPSHPIPTQTFTNQSFAVMQNMMLPPQAYVPVTVHHGPPMAPIAVVPAGPPGVVPVPVVPVPVAVQELVLDGKSEIQVRSCCVGFTQFFVKTWHEFLPCFLNF